MSQKTIKNAFVKIKISDDNSVLTIKTSAVLELLANMVNASIEMKEKDELRLGIISEGFHTDYLEGFHASSKIMYDTFASLVNKAEVDYAIGDITPGSISKINPEQI